MDSSTVHRLLSSVTQEPLFQLKSTSSEEAKTLVQEILTQISATENHEKRFTAFSTTLIRSLEQACIVPEVLFNKKREVLGGISQQTGA